MDALTALQRRERIIALVRVVALLFAVLHVSVYEPPVAGLGPLAEASRPLGYAVAGGLALVAVLVEIALRGISTAGALRRAGALFLGADVVLGLLFVSLYAFDPIASPWAALALLPLEGALRFDLRGALLTWVVIAPVTLLTDIASSVVVFSPGRALYRIALLGVVAVFAGGMARDLDQQRRLLAGVADGSRQLVGRIEPAEIFRVLCREVVQCLGARSAVMYVHDGSWFQAVASWPPEELVEVLSQDLGEAEDPIVADHVRHVPVWLPADGSHPERLAVPLRADGRLGTHVLIIRPAGRRRFSRFESDAAGSLAESAALALATTRVLTAEQRTNRRLRYLEALRTRFVATVAHDLRLPLTVFKGVASLVRNRRDSISSEQMDELLDSVTRQANRLSRLADDLLDAARVDADKLTLHVDDIALQELVLTTVGDSEEEVSVDVPDDLRLVADGPRLERILWNLLSNAEKYGRPPFEIRAARVDDAIEIAVRDHGSGLTEEQRDRLFDDFAGSDDAASVGLGLAIVWQLVTAHGGQVHYVDAAPGARFVVRLPVAGPPPVEGPSINLTETEAATATEVGE